MTHGVPEGRHAKFKSDGKKKKIEKPRKPCHIYSSWDTIPFLVPMGRHAPIRSLYPLPFSKTQKVDK